MRKQCYASAVASVTSQVYNSILPCIIHINSQYACGNEGAGITRISHHTNLYVVVVGIIHPGAHTQSVNRIGSSIEGREHSEGVGIHSDGNIAIQKHHRRRRPYGEVPAYHILRSSVAFEVVGEGDSFQEAFGISHIFIRISFCSTNQGGDAHEVFRSLIQTSDSVAGSGNMGIGDCPAGFIFCPVLHLPHCLVITRQPVECNRGNSGSVYLHRGRSSLSHSHTRATFENGVGPVAIRIAA